jgi:hypothetical protein
MWGIDRRRKMVDVMIKDGELHVTHKQGQVLLNKVSTIEMPKEIGDQKFDAVDRAFINDGFVKLKELLISNSTRKRDPVSVCFGNPGNWEVRDGYQGVLVDGKKEIVKMPVWDLKDENEVYVLKGVDDKIREAIYWELFLLGHVDSPVFSGVVVLGEVLWPLARAVDAERQLRKDFKLDAERKTRIKWDSEYKAKGK